MGKEIQALTGLTRSHAINLKQRYFSEGISCLTDKRQGKPKELLTKKQREKIIETVKNKAPNKLGYGSDHWTTGILADLIEKEYKVKYKSKTSLYLVFRKAKFSYHRPATRYDLQDEKEIED